ncbi:MAG: glutathione peroxidase [Gammaproteobacteria bacterium]|nr:glutathione peroxidase [Gammaproteobacteria bacterium]
MKPTVALLLLAVSGWLAPATASHAEEACADTLDFHFRALGEERTVHLCESFRDKVVLVVNTASRCGFTDQYDGLEKLYASYRDRGLVVLGFPSNDFGGQEPGNEAQIKSFCRTTYGVQFPMFEKTRAAAGGAHPFFDRLAAEGGGHPRWNFHKYLLDRDGRVVASWRSRVEPTDPVVIEAIEARL